MELKAGISGSAETVVVHENTAAAVGSGALEVFSTPSMISLMEKAALEAVAPFLEPGQTTVGIRLEVSHLAATPLGRSVTAAAELVSVEKRILKFKVSASSGDELIGEGMHTRCIVDAERFMVKALAK